MPALDDCFPQVVHALQKDGWVVGNKPERKLFGKRLAYIDLVARNEAQAAYVEVKCFPSAGAGGGGTQEEYIAVGQYIVYRTLLETLEDSTPLYLAVPHTIFEDFDDVMRNVIGNYHIKLLVFDAATEEVLQWIE